MEIITIASSYHDAVPTLAGAYCPLVTRRLQLLLPFFMPFQLPSYYGGAKAAARSGCTFSQSELTGAEIGRLSTPHAEGGNCIGYLQVTTAVDLGTRCLVLG